jgi:hypothetical protein
MNDIDRIPRTLLRSLVIAAVLGAGCDLSDADDVLVFTVPATQPTDPATGIAAHLYVRAKVDRELLVATANGVLRVAGSAAAAPASCVAIRGNEPAELQVLIHPAQIETAVEAVLRVQGADASAPTCAGRIVDMSTIFVKSSAPMSDAGVVDADPTDAEASNAR